MPTIDGNGFQGHELNVSSVFTNINNKNIVWTKVLLLKEKNEPLLSRTAHIIVKEETIFLGANTNNITLFEQETTQYPEIPVCLFYLKISTFV